MAQETKRTKANAGKFNATEVYTIDAAIDALKGLQAAKFDETIEVALRLGIDAKKSDQNVRFATVLPNGTGKTVRVAAFTDSKADEAKAAGADIVGYEDLAAEIKKGNLDFDILVATPDAMREIGKLGKILGSKGLMPNPKVGTVAADIATAVKNAKSGQVTARNDKNGIIHAGIGKMSFDKPLLIENLKAFVDAVSKAKPTTAKGQFLKSLVVSSSMGPGLKVDMSSLS